VTNLDQMRSGESADCKLLFGSNIKNQEYIQKALSDQIQDTFSQQLEEAMDPLLLTKSMSYVPQDSFKELMEWQNDKDSPERHHLQKQPTQYNQGHQNMPIFSIAFQSVPGGIDANHQHGTVSMKNQQYQNNDDCMFSPSGPGHYLCQNHHQSPSSQMNSYPRPQLMLPYPIIHSYQPPQNQNRPHYYYSDNNHHHQELNSNNTCDSPNYYNNMSQQQAPFHHPRQFQQHHQDQNQSQYPPPQQLFSPQSQLVLKSLAANWKWCLFLSWISLIVHQNPQILSTTRPLS
jgi:hypothetical protein